MASKMASSSDSGESSVPVPIETSVGGQSGHDTMGGESSGLETRVKLEIRNGGHQEPVKQLHPVDHHPLEPLTLATVTQPVLYTQSTMDTNSQNHSSTTIDTITTSCPSHAGTTIDTITSSCPSHAGSNVSIDTNLGISPEVSVRPKVGLRSKPSSPVESPILSGDIFSNWIHCICVVTFDIELGQAIEVRSPDQILSEI